MAMAGLERPSAGRIAIQGTDITRLGRHPDSEISLDDITVSRRHAEVQRTAEGYVVADSGSLNGTYVNQERVERAQLRHGDELQIGVKRRQHDGDRVVRAGVHIED